MSHVLENCCIDNVALANTGGERRLPRRLRNSDESNWQLENACRQFIHQSQLFSLKFLRHTQVFSASSSILTRSFQFTPKRLWSDIRASNATRFRRMFLPSPTPHIDPCCKVNEYLFTYIYSLLVCFSSTSILSSSSMLWWGGKKRDFTDSNHRQIENIN